MATREASTEASPMGEPRIQVLPPPRSLTASGADLRAQIEAAVQRERLALDWFLHCC